MKKLLLLFLTGSSTAASAQDWTPYAQTSLATQYFDLQRAVAMGNTTAFIVDLHDLKSETKDPNGKTYLSVVYATEFNCRKAVRRILSYQRMSERMGNGAVVSEYTEVGEWSDVKAPGLTRLMTAACEQR